MKLRYQRISYRGADAAGRQLERMLDYLWDPARNSHLGFHGEWRPPVDLFQTADEMTLLVEIAGMKEDDIEVALFNDVVIITGERKPPLEPGEDLTYHEAGIRYGRFRADVFLPASVDPDRAQAWYENGFLKIGLPKSRVRIQPE